MTTTSPSPLTPRKCLPCLSIFLMSKICSFLGVPFFQDTSAILGSAAPFQDAQIVGGAVLEAPTYCVPLFVWQSNKATLSFSSIKKKKKKAQIVQSSIWDLCWVLGPPTPPLISKNSKPCLSGHPEDTAQTISNLLIKMMILWPSPNTHTREVPLSNFLNSVLGAEDVPITWVGNHLVTWLHHLFPWAESLTTKSYLSNVFVIYASLTPHLGF